MPGYKIVIAIAAGLIPAFIARHKGQNFLAWWFYGAVLFVVALTHALMLRPGTGVRCQVSGVREKPVSGT